MDMNSQWPFEQAACAHAFKMMLSERASVTLYKRLAFCKAWIYETEHYYILLADNNDIACMDKRDGIVYDRCEVSDGYRPAYKSYVKKFADLFAATEVYHQRWPA